MAAGLSVVISAVLAIALVALLVDDCLDAVADRDHSDQLVILDDRQVADALLGHQHHAVADGILRVHVDHW